MYKKLFWYKGCRFYELIDFDVEGNLIKDWSDLLYAIRNWKYCVVLMAEYTGKDFMSTVWYRKIVQQPCRRKKMNVMEVEVCWEISSVCYSRFRRSRIRDPEGESCLMTCEYRGNMKVKYGNKEKTIMCRDGKYVKNQSVDTLNINWKRLPFRSINVGCVSFFIGRKWGKRCVRVQLQLVA